LSRLRKKMTKKGETARKSLATAAATTAAEDAPSKRAAPWRRTDGVAAADR
jgi:hypothetical protein